MGVSTLLNIKVKLALLEKGIDFEEVRVPQMGPKTEGMLAMSPLGKVPWIETEQGSLCESQVIVDYIEARWPAHALIPTDPFQAAKVRELCLFMELHVELCARQLYPQAFFGATLPEKYVARVRADLEKHLSAFKRLMVLGPYAAGDTFTIADCCAYVHLPLAGLASKLVLGEDLVNAVGIDWKAYVKLIEQRPTAQRVAADRKADQARLVSP